MVRTATRTGARVGKKIVATMLTATERQALDDELARRSTTTSALVREAVSLGLGRWPTYVAIRGLDELSGELNAHGRTLNLIARRTNALSNRYRRAGRLTQLDIRRMLSDLALVADEASAFERSCAKVEGLVDSISHAQAVEVEDGRSRDGDRIYPARARVDDDDCEALSALARDNGMRPAAAVRTLLLVVVRLGPPAGMPPGIVLPVTPRDGARVRMARRRWHGNVSQVPVALRRLVDALEGNRTVDSLALDDARALSREIVRATRRAEQRMYEATGRIASVGEG